MNSRCQWLLVLALIACLSGTMSHSMQPVASRAASRYFQPTLSRASNYISSFWRPTAPQVPQPSYYRPATWYGRIYDRFWPAERLPVRQETYEMLRYDAQKAQEEAKKTVTKAELLEKLQKAKAMAKAQLNKAQDKLRKTGPLFMQARRDARVPTNDPNADFHRGIWKIGTELDFGLAKLQRDRNMKSLKDIERLKREIIEW